MDEATRVQIEAADPGGSTWLSANAGSGKTRVLTDRVARLLLGGADPGRILCLTYTRAAAAEMQNRLFQRLGAWAMLDDGPLAAELAALGERVAEADTLARARRLFARALETPGGLKIQTIHAFCAAILRRFPLEAGVPPDFAEADERGLARLRDEVLDRVAGGAGAGALDRLLAAESDGNLRPILAAIEGLDPAALAAAGTPETLFGLPPGYGRHDLERAVFDGSEADLLGLRPALAASGVADRRLGERLAALGTPGGLAALPELERALLTGKDARAAGPFASKAGTIPTKALRARLDPALIARLDALADRVAAARPRRLALAAAEATAALWDFARLWAAETAAARAAKGLLRFDDLVARTRRLLADPAVAQWVLWKLDGGIDHILVDEAQDTSPAQWAIVERLVAELTAGGAGRGRPRTLFVVGDRKQSIFAFQGADLRGFGAARARLASALAAQGGALPEMELRHSFRSAPAVLRVVDGCFRTDPGGLGEAPQHLAFRPDAAGRVDLWPALPPPTTEAEQPWDDPVDRPPPEHPELVLARALAAELRRLIDTGTPIETRTGVERLHEGHILILVRRRSGRLFRALLQACKAEGLAMAGADRLDLGADPAVRDVLALLQAVALPEDDLSLATALRSALFGWSEDRLFRLAHGRGALPLAARLRDDPAADAAAAQAVLADLGLRAGFLRPYELVERVLARHDGRRRLLARYGPEAEEPLEALAELALAYEEREVPSLDGFLAWLAAGEAELKRQVEGGGRRLRIMTVHGAKGLEAPLVVLPDTADRSDPGGGPLLTLHDLPVPRAPADRATPAQAAAAAAEVVLRAEERDRLLYVALTRAERWLIVAAAGKTDAAGGWYARIAGAVAEAGAERIDTPLGPGWRHAQNPWPAAVPGPAASPAARSARAAQRGLSLPPAAPRLAAVAPSDLGGPMALPAEPAAPTPTAADPAAARARGRLVHALLERLPGLPGPARAQAAAALAARHGAGLPAGLRAEAVAEALTLARDPAVAAVFGPGSRAEVALAGTWADRPMIGTVDRLLVAPGRVLAVEIKTNRLVPDRPEAVPEGILRQLGAYAHLLAALHPDARIETAVLWTAAARLMPLPAPLVGAALARAAAGLVAVPDGGPN